MLVQDGRKWRSSVSRVRFATLGGAGTCQWAGALCHCSLICFLILPARSAAWSECLGGVNLFFPCPHGRIRSNESTKQYLCLLGLFWTGTFHLIRTRCVRNKGVFFLPVFPYTLPQTPLLSEYLKFQNYTAKLCCWAAPEAGSALGWGCQCRLRTGCDEQPQC